MNAVTTEAATLGKVTGLKQVDATDNFVKFAWDAQLGSYMRYVVEYSTDKVTWVEYDRVEATDVTIHNLSAGKTCFVRVKAITLLDGGEGSYSDPMEVVTTPNNTSERVTQAAATSNSVTMRWDAVPGATSYDVYYKCMSLYGHEMVLAGSTTGTSATITGLPGDDSCSIAVYPRRTAGQQSIQHL